MNVGSFIFRAMFNLVYWQRLRDPFTMAKVFRRDCVPGMKLECNRFDFDWELLAKLLHRGLHAGRGADLLPVPFIRGRQEDPDLPRLGHLDRRLLPLPLRPVRKLTGILLDLFP